MSEATTIDIAKISLLKNFILYVWHEATNCSMQPSDEKHNPR